MTKVATAHRHDPLHVADVRAMLRLCNALHESPGETEERKRRLLQGLRELTDADRASTSVASFIDPVDVRRAAAAAATGTAPPVISAVEPRRVVSVIHAGFNGSSAPAHPCPWRAYRTRHRGRRARNADTLPLNWCLSASAPPSAPSRRGGGAKTVTTPGGHYVHSFLPLAGGHVVACLTVGRDARRPQFSGRDRAIICALHAEVAWLYRADVVLVSPDVLALAPQVREVLRHLLAGKGEKQIAAEMARRYNTIHHYVKTLYKHFNVSSRSELLARWVGTKVKRRK